MNTPTQIEKKLSQVFEERQAIVLAEVIHDEYSDLVKTSDFNELKEIVRSLAVETQGLATAQRRTETRVEELTTAQQRTEERLDELAVQTQGLATAQQQTERALQNLSRQVGGLSNRMGGDLEDLAYIVLHDLLARELGWEVDVLTRSWQQWNGQEEEIDIFGRAHDPERPDIKIWVVGEVKFNLTLREVQRFITKVERAREYLDGEVFPVCFCYRARPEVQKAVTDAGFRLAFSYGRLV